MASPFKVFRKHQKILIATLGVLAMVAFVFLPIILQSMDNRTVENPVVVRTEKYGNLKRYDIGQLIGSRQRTLNFLEEVLRAVLENGGRGDTVRMVANSFGRDPTGEETVVNTWLFAKHAEELGILISKDAINDFIVKVTENRVKPAQLKAIFKRIRISQRQMYEILRHELLAMRLLKFFEISLGGATPAQRWSYFKRLEQKATVGLIPLAVSNFVRDVKEPDKETLREFFDKHKFHYARPNSPEPGFRRPRRVALEYFVAEYDKFADPDAITAEELKTHYEENKEYFDETGATEIPREKLDEIRTGTDDGTSAEEPLIAPTDEPGAGLQEPESGEGADENQPEEPDETSSVGARSPFRLASLLQADDGEASPSEQAAQAAGAESPPAEPEASGPEPEAPPPSPALPAESESPEPELVAPTDEPGTTMQEPVAEPPKGLYVSTEELLAGPMGKVVRKHLARQKADEKIKEIFERLEIKMGEYQNEYNRYEANKGDEAENPKATPPPPLDFDAMAKTEGLTADETGLVSQSELAESEVGASYVEGTFQQVVQVAFQRPTFLATRSNTFGGPERAFLFWKVEETKRRAKDEKKNEGVDPRLLHGIPEFDDPGVKEKVLGVWQMVQARSLAAKKAQQLAAEANKGDRSLQDTFAGRTDLSVTKTDPFSWMTRPAVPMGTSQTRPELGRVDGIDMPGNDFMRTVFSLGPGEVGVAMNYPETVAYVVRVVEIEPLDSVLWTMFKSDHYGNYAAAAWTDQSEVFRAWREGLESAAGFQWERAPESGRNE